MSGAESNTKDKIAVIGSGNWGSAIAKVVGENTLRHSTRFMKEVSVWVFEETLESGEKLTEIINTQHENVKYLPGVRLGANVVAMPDLEAVVENASMLIFVLPPQFLERLLPTIRKKVRPGARAISLIKGISFNDRKEVVLISDMIRKGLGEGVDVSVLMGANVASEVAAGHFCEATLGYRVKGNAELWRYAFDSPSFRVRLANDSIGVELCGGLKNIVGLGAGYCDGLGYGSNTKAAIIRLGLMDMIHFGRVYFSGVRDSTFFESCGVADLITECYGGRNRRCAEIFVRTGKSWEVIEKEVLLGQKLQGAVTALRVYELLERDGKISEFPFFSTVYKIAFDGMDPSMITKMQDSLVASKPAHMGAGAAAAAKASHGLEGQRQDASGKDGADTGHAKAGRGGAQKAEKT